MQHQYGIRVLVTVVAITLALGCMERESEPARPAGLPADAFWLGGSDGGVFVLLKRQDNPAFTEYAGAIFHRDGSLWYRGRFILEPSGGQPVDPASRKQFIGWDGTRVLLRDGRGLVAKPVKQPERSGHSE